MATLSGHLTAVKWLRGHRIDGVATVIPPDRVCMWDSYTFGHAVSYASLTGNMEQLEWICDSDCPRDTSIDTVGRLSVLQFLMGRDITLDSDASIIDILNEETDITDRLQVVSWMIDNGYGIDVSECIENPHSDAEWLAILQCLHGRGCDVTRWRRIVTKRGYLSSLQYIANNRNDWDMLGCLNTALDYNRAEIVDWIQLLMHT